jgi:hypothetical protein
MNFERLDGHRLGEMDSNAVIARNDSRAFPKQHHSAVWHTAIGILKRGARNSRLGQNAIGFMAERFESSNNRLHGADGDVRFQVSHSFSE